MEPKSPSSTLRLDPVPEVPLERAPLEKVLAEVRFSSTSELITDESERALAALLTRYPVRRQVRSSRVVINPIAQSTVTSAVPTRTFADTGNSWIVTVSDSSISIETTSYESRSDFCERTSEVFNAIASVRIPPVVDRVGLRYIDRIVDDFHLAHLEEYINPSLRVLHGATDGRLSLEHSVSDSMVRISEDERLKVRAGLLPPSAIFDPSLAPVDTASWVLDLDIFTVRGGISFDPQGLVERIRSYSAHIYSVFRWATTDVFLKAFREDHQAAGGQEA